MWRSQRDPGGLQVSSKFSAILSQKVKWRKTASVNLWPPLHKKHCSCTHTYMHMYAYATAHHTHIHTCSHTYHVYIKKWLFFFLCHHAPFTWLSFSPCLLTRLSGSSNSWPRNKSEIILFTNGFRWKVVTKSEDAVGDWSWISKESHRVWPRVMVNRGC